MSRVAVAGAGQAGLQLALALVSSGHEVTLATDRSGAEIAAGRILSTQCMFDDALATERALGIDHWQDECPQIDGVQYSLGAPDAGRVMCFSGRLPAPAQSVDQRLKMPRWLDDLEAAGGRVVLGPLDVATLERLAAGHDLLVVASTKGPIARELPALFPRIAEESPFDAAQRELGVAYVHGMEPLPSPGEFSISIVPGDRRVLRRAGAHALGLVLDDVPRGDPGRPDGRLGPRDSRAAGAVAGRARGRPRRALPLGGRAMPLRRAHRRQGDARRIHRAGGALPGRPAAVRAARARDRGRGRPERPARRSGCEQRGQGRDRRRRRDRRADAGAARRRGAGCETWATEYWRAVAAATQFTNTMLSPPAHVGALFEAGARSPAVADALANATNDPRTLVPYLGSAEGIAEFAALHDPTIWQRPGAG